MKTPLAGFTNHLVQASHIRTCQVAHTSVWVNYMGTFLLYHLGDTSGDVGAGSGTLSDIRRIFRRGLVTSSFGLSGCSSRYPHEGNGGVDDTVEMYSNLVRSLLRQTCVPQGHDSYVILYLQLRRTNHKLIDLI